jgi:dUTP pyrophosphatase
MFFIDVQKIYKEAKVPQRAHKSDAGADIFFYDEQSSIVTIEPGKSMLIKTGIRMAVPHGLVAEVKNKSGIASKRSLIVGACIIDSGYTGEVMVNLHNIGEYTQHFNRGDKIAQIVVYPVECPDFEEIESDKKLFYRTRTESQRNEGGFGSTGEK